ncbi:MAG: ClbS/DfsB family four-helix bundle protein, partial [Carnobacterium sp.]|nr:ClbS/DfsB family four-helix bundle protein [Carnobacterium sp.]
MREYSGKKELVDTIQKKYQKYISEFATIPENLKEKRVEDVDKTPSENLSYQLGWINLLLQWEKDEQQGKDVKTPAKGYKWNNLGGLYQSFYNQYGSFSLKEQEILLTKSVMELCEWINSLSDKEL